MDEFYVTSGTRVAPPKGAVTKAPAPPAAAAEAAFVDVAQLGPALDLLEGLVRREAWDDALAERKRSPALRALSRSGFGLPGDTVSAAAEELRGELDFVISQFFDACLQQRVLYFNKEDLRQVSRMMDADDEERLDAGRAKRAPAVAPTAEALALLGEARAVFKRMQ